MQPNNVNRIEIYVLLNRRLEEISIRRAHISGCPGAANKVSIMKALYDVF